MLFQNKKLIVLAYSFLYVMSASAEDFPLINSICNEALQAGGITAGVMTVVAANYFVGLKLYENSTENKQEVLIGKNEILSTLYTGLKCSVPVVLVSRIPFSEQVNAKDLMKPLAIGAMAIFGIQAIVGVCTYTFRPKWSKKFGICYPQADQDNLDLYSTPEKAKATAYRDAWRAGKLAPGILSLGLTFYALNNRL